MPGKTYLKVTGVLLVIGGIMSLLVYPIAGLLFTGATVSTGEALGWLFVVICVAYAVAGVLQLIAGVKAVKGCDKKSVATELKKWGTIVLVITVIASVINFINAVMNGQSVVSSVVSVLIGFIVPLLYMHGASLNEKA